MKNGGGGVHGRDLGERRRTSLQKNNKYTAGFSASTSQQTVTSQTHPPTCPLHRSLPPAVFFLGQYGDHARS
ncbi:hypothetical protein BDZ89DRAFT_361960 [Hymenopellis radicata]|nr:hypothetical protein BDZ89DRAFT_361960 [Hymenopellis radicata]